MPCSAKYRFFANAPQPQEVIMKLVKLTLTSVFISGCMLLTACSGGSGDGGAQVATSITTATIDAAIAGSVAGKPFPFPAGVPVLGTTGPTKINFVSGPPSGFSITSPEGSASGTLDFNPCRFIATTSTYPASHPLATGKTVVISSCTLSINTVGAAADGTPADRDTALILGITPSDNIRVPVIVLPNGNVFIGGTLIGNTPLTPATGAGS